MNNGAVIAPLFGNCLLTKTQSGQDRAIPCYVVLCEIRQQVLALAYQLDKAASSGMILLVHCEMRRECVDVLCDQSDLNFRQTRVCCGATELLNDLSFALFGDHKNPE